MHGTYEGGVLIFLRGWTRARRVDVTTGATGGGSVDDVIELMTCAAEGQRIARHGRPPRRMARLDRTIKKSG